MSIEVSILVPVYNVECYLERCLNSILNQTFRDFECILVDDGSPDNSGLICDSFAKKDNRIKVIHQSNKGLAGARNTGLNNVKGKYFICVDSDDWLEPNYIEELLSEARLTDADIVGCDLIREQSEKAEIQEVALIKSKDICSSILNGTIPGWVWIKMFKTELFEKNDISWIEGIDMCEDTLISLKAFHFAKKVSYVNKPLYHYNLQNQNSLTFVLNEKRVNQIILSNEEYNTFLREQKLLEKYSYDLLRRKALSKLWILLDCDKCKREYFKIYNNESLHKVKELSFFSKVFLLLLKINMIYSARFILFVKKRLDKVCDKKNIS